MVLLRRETRRPRLVRPYRRRVMSHAARGCAHGVNFAPRLLRVKPGQGTFLRQDVRCRPPRILPVLDGPPGNGKEGRRGRLGQIEFGPAQPDAFAEGHWVRVKLDWVKLSRIKSGRVKSKRTDCAGISRPNDRPVKCV